MTTIVILAGGKSFRMGRDKMMLGFGTSTMLSENVRRFSEKFADVAVSVGEMSKYPDIDCRHIADIYPGCGPMSGIHAALSETGGDIFAVAGDMPFSSPDAALDIISRADGFDAVVPKSDDGRLEPLFAWYSHRALPVIENHLKSGDYKLARLFDEINVLYVPSPGDKILDNINRPEDYERIKGGDFT